MAAVEINDWASLWRWLRSLEKGQVEITSIRAAARVFPLWECEIEGNSIKSAAKKLREVFSAITVLQLLIVSILAHAYDNSESRTRASRVLRNNATKLAAQSKRKNSVEPPIDALRSAKSLARMLALIGNYYSFNSRQEPPHIRASYDVIVHSFNAFVVSPMSSESDSEKFWGALSRDGDLLSGGHDLSGYQLWPKTPPDWFTSADAEMRAIWAKDPETWAFWVRWWDGVIAGRPLPLDLQREVALIEDKIWQQGPKAVAEEIAKIEAKYAQQDEPDYRVSPKTQLNAEVLVRAAIADFTFDEIRRLMRMVPFPEDIDLLTDAVLLEKFLRDAKGISRSIETMKTAFLAEGRAMQGAGGLATYLDAVLEEFSAARQLGELNVGWVIECGDILQGYTLSAEVNAEIGPLGLPLKASVQKLLELTRTYFASTLLRFAPLKDIRSREETSLVALMEDLRRGLKVISSQPDDTRIGVAPEAIAVFEKLMASIDRIIQAEFLATDPARKTTLRRDIDFMMAQVAVSIMLSWESGKGAAKGVTKGSYKVLEAATVLDQGPGALESLINKVLAAIGK